MQNPFMSSDDEVKSDEADREHAGGRTDSARDEATDAETKAADYRDDPSGLGASSDYAQRGTTNRYSGQSPGDESGFAGSRESRGTQSGSQEQWRGPAAAPANAGTDSPTQDAAPDGEAYGAVPSRSADPGQSSYGGFRNEGPSPHDALQQKAADGDEAKPTGDADEK